MYKVLITGASGAVGNGIVEFLANYDYELHGTFRTSTISSTCISHKIDLSKEQSLAKISSIKPDVLIHCAALKPNTSFDFSPKQKSVNRKIDLNIINYLGTHPNCKSIYMSTTSLYSTDSQLKTEKSPVFARGLYHRIKLDFENSFLNLNNNNSVFRLSSPYGKNTENGSVINYFFDKVINNKDISYFGSGGRTQDFIYTEDVGHAVMKSITKINCGGIYNITAGQSISMRELAEKIVKAVPNNKSKVIQSKKLDNQEHYRANFSNSKAEEILNWKPQTSIEEGIRKLIKHRNQGPVQ